LYGRWRLSPSFPPFTKGRDFPSLAKRGQGRFSEEDVFSIIYSSIRWKQNGKKMKNTSTFADITEFNKFKKASKNRGLSHK
jgi:hypothetical protein